MKVISFILIILGVLGAFADSHKLQYYFTVVSDPSSGLSKFSIDGYLDDQQIVMYRSDVGKDSPVVPWMNEEGPEYWDRETKISKQMEVLFKEMMSATMSRFNYTRGTHYGQWISKCELKEDGSKLGDTYIRFDGRDFIHLDPKNGLWIATMNEADITTQEWNFRKGRWGESQRDYLNTDCIHWLKRFLAKGREDLEKRVRPEVKVWEQQQSDGMTRLQCLVYGFYPQAVDVKWVRNGRDHISSYETTPILPHPDGTYQITVSVEVPTREGDTYSCHVEHSSLGTETLGVKWEPDKSFSTGAIVGAVFACLIVVGIAAFVCKKIKNRNVAPQEASIQTPIHPRNDMAP